MIEYELAIALDNAELYTSADVLPISGEGLQKLVQQYQSVQNTISRMSRHYPEMMIQELVYQPALTQAMMKSEEQIREWAENYINAISAKESGASIYSYEVTFNSERQLYEAQINVRTHGVDYTYKLGFEFSDSNEYIAIIALGEQLNGLIEEGAYVSRGERKQEISQFEEAINWLIKESRRGLSVQRYKGLGEMNPEQLWETTMDPDARHMLQVTIKDAVAADQLFTTLMGDEVEPRRDFIESNALYANLDI